jgi:transposase, IS5 family
MLRLEGVQTQCLFDQVLPEEVRELPEDLAQLDELLADSALLAPIEPTGRQRRPNAVDRDCERTDRRSRWPPTCGLMVIKQRTGWGYETLVKDVSDSLHLRRFCLIGLSDGCPTSRRCAS